MDIVKRLRVKHTETIDTTGCSKSLSGDAADEIEKLQAEVSDLRFQARNLIVSVDKLAAERDALQAIINGDWPKNHKLDQDRVSLPAYVVGLEKQNDKLKAERDALARFVNWIVEDHPESYPDVFAIQDEAERVGIFINAKPKEPCGEGCQCAEYYSGEEWDAGEVKCLRLAQWIKGAAMKEGT